MSYTLSWRGFTYSLTRSVHYEAVISRNPGSLDKYKSNKYH